MRRGQPLAGGVGLHQLRGLQRCRGDHGLPAAAVGRFVASAGLPAAVDSRAEAVCARGGRREIGYTPRVGTVAAWALLPALRRLSAATSWGLNSGARLRVHAGAQGR
jgi:hypothetical protein